MGDREFRTFAIPSLPTTPRPCSAGIGTKGGRSHGKGSGSRMRLWQCECAKLVKVRVTSDDFQATCHRCGTWFKRTEQSRKEGRAMNTITHSRYWPPAGGTHTLERACLLAQ